MPEGSKSSTLKHLKKVWEATGEIPKELKELPDKPSLGYLYDMYVKFPFEFKMTELKAWCELTSTKLNPVEVEILALIHGILLKTTNAR